MLTTNKKLLATYNLCEEIYLEDFRRVVKKYPDTYLIEDLGNPILVIKGRKATYNLYMDEEDYSLWDSDEIFRPCGYLCMTSDRDDSLRIFQLQIGKNNTCIMTHDDIHAGTPYGFLEDSLFDETRSWESVGDDEKKKLMDEFLTIQTIKLQECLVESRGYCYYEDKWEADQEVIYGKMEDIVAELLTGKKRGRKVTYA